MRDKRENYNGPTATEERGASRDKKDKGVGSKVWRESKSGEGESRGGRSGHQETKEGRKVVVSKRAATVSKQEEQRGTSNKRRGVGCVRERRGGNYKQGDRRERRIRQ